MFLIALGVIAAGAALVAGARGLARSYANGRLRSEREATDAAIDAAQAVCDAAERDVQAHARRRNGEMAALRAALQARIAADRAFYEDLAPRLEAYAARAIEFDGVHKRLGALRVARQELQESRALIDKAQTRNRAHDEQIRQAMDTLRRAADTRPRLDLLAVHHPELAAELAAAEPRADRVRRVLEDFRKRQQDPLAGQALRTLLTLLDEQSGIADDLDQLRWALHEVGVQRDALRGHRQAVAQRLGVLRDDQQQLFDRRDALANELLPAARALLAHAEAPFQAARARHAQARAHAQASSREVSDAFQALSALKSDIDRLRGTADWTDAGTRRFAQLKRERDAIGQQIDGLKAMKAADWQVVERLKTELDDAYARRQAVATFFAEQGLDDLQPARLERKLLQRIAADTQRSQDGHA